MFQKRLTRLCIFLALLMSKAALGQTLINYARKGAKVSFEIDWRVDNYGVIQWQRSIDNGETWTNINNETHPVFEFTANADGQYRAKIIGQEECEPSYITRKIKTVDFDVVLDSVSENTAKFEITNIDFQDANIVEYGFSYNLSELHPRSYKDMFKSKVGKSFPAEDTVYQICENLLPNTTYSIRLYFITEDGSIIYGPGRIAETLPGIKWTNEGWQINQTSISARFEVAGLGITADDPNLIFKFGDAPENLSVVEVTDLGDYKYASVIVENLSPNTVYYAQAEATVNGKLQLISKEIKTLPDYSGITIDPEPGAVKHTIRWDNTKTLHQISPEGLQAEYPRIIRVSPDTLLCSYHGGTEGDYWVNIYLQKSFDNGKTWTTPTVLMDKEKSIMGDRYWRFANPEMIRLKNGWILMPFIGNGKPETNDNCHVMVMTSKDNGETWSDPQIIGRGRTWEPQIIQLQNGELEMLVASEATWYGTGGDLYQEIMYSRSTDNGETWSKFKRACYSPNRRDGMPVALNLQGNKGILFSIEIVNDNGFGSPSLVHRSLTGEWDETPWDGVSGDKRWYVNVDGHGGAPYMIQLPTGEIVLSAHVNGRNGIWQTSYPRITVGDSDGKNFTTPVTPITGLPSNEGAYYNSLFLKDDETVWLVITHSLYDGSKRVKGEIQYLEGKIIVKN